MDSESPVFISESLSPYKKKSLGELNKLKKHLKLFRTHFITNDIVEVKYYKSYDNKLNKI